MPPKDKDFGFGCVTFLFLAFGSVYLAYSIMALKHGTTISFGRGTKIQISPWIGITISAMLLIIAILGIIKIWKDKDKFPPL
jgi:hypothetical protein